MCKPQVLVRRRNTPSWWREAGESGTKKLYQATSPSLGLSSTLSPSPPFWGGFPAGDHGTIPAKMRHRKKDFFEYGKCDQSARPGSGSKLYYINSWAMCWPSDHAKKPLTG